MSCNVCSGVYDPNRYQETRRLLTKGGGIDRRGTAAAGSSGDLGVQELGVHYVGATVYLGDILIWFALDEGPQQFCF